MPGGFEDSSGSFDSFLDEFVVKVYLPQLEARVTSLFQEAVGSSDSFLESSGWELLSHRPLVKVRLRIVDVLALDADLLLSSIKQCSTQVLTLINNLCAMLRTTPFHREDYSRLIISVIVQFYQRCSTFFKGEARRSSEVGRELIARISQISSLATSRRQEAKNSLICVYLPCGLNGQNLLPVLPSCSVQTRETYPKCGSCRGRRPGLRLV